MHSQLSRLLFSKSYSSSHLKVTINVITTDHFQPPLKCKVFIRSSKDLSTLRYHWFSSFLYMYRFKSFADFTIFRLFVNIPDPSKYSTTSSPLSSFSIISQFGSSIIFGSKLMSLISQNHSQSLKTPIFLWFKKFKFMQTYETFDKKQTDYNCTGRTSNKL